MAQVTNAARWLLLAFGARALLLPLSATGNVTFPTDLFSVAELAEEIRSPIGLKIRDMRKAFGTRAHSGTQVDFVGADATKALGIQYFRALNPEKTKRTERTRISSAKGSPLVSETIVTEGTKLDFSDAALRAYLGGSPDYGLLPNENSKRVILQFGTNEAFRFSSVRSADGSTTRTQVLYGETLVLTVTDITDLEGTRRSMEYVATGNRFRVGGLGSFYSSSSVPSHVCKISGVQSITGTLFTMGCDGAPIATYSQFSQFLSEFIYTRLFIESALPLISGLIQTEFPAVVRPPNLAAGGKFYTDLLNMLTLLETHRAHPAILTVISTLRGYISLIQDGTVEIKDYR